jgi:hypothetical protein
MEPLQMDFLILALNAILIALILTAPLFVGLLIIRLLRKGISVDRNDFEDDVRSKLGKIEETQAELMVELTKFKVASGLQSR